MMKRQHIPIRLVYKTAKRRNDVGIENYKVPRQPLRHGRKSSFTKEKRKCFLDINNLSPGPAKHGMTLNQSLKQFWLKGRGKFLPVPTALNSKFSEILKKRRVAPGPGAYKPGNWRDSFLNLRRSNTAEGFTFMSDIAYVSEQTPAASRYHPNYTLLKSVAPIWEIKKDLGPDMIRFNKKRISKLSSNNKSKNSAEARETHIEKADKVCMKRAQSAVIGKARKKSLIESNARIHKDDPPIGAYYDHRRPFSPGKTVIMPYKIKRFTDSVMESKKSIPGPGAYDSSNFI